MTTWRLVLCVAVATLLGACADGYPAGDTGLMLRHDMSVDESIEAMNQPGENPELGQRWKYQLKPGCVLAIGSGGRLKQKEDVQVSLAASQSAMGKHDEGQDYRVIVRRDITEGSDTTQEQVVVVDEATWNDATQMRWLLDHVRARCAHSASNP